MKFFCENVHFDQKYVLIKTFQLPHLLRLTAQMQITTNCGMNICTSVYFMESFEPDVR